MPNAPDELFAFILTVCTLIGLVYGWIVWAKPAIIWIKERITKRRLQIEQLAFELRWYKQHSPLPMFRLDAELNVIWSNKSLNELLDVDSTELLGKMWFNIVRPSELDAVTSKWRSAVLNQAPFTNTQVMHVNGKYRKYLVTGDPFIYGGKIREYIGTVVLLEE